MEIIDRLMARLGYVPTPKNQYIMSSYRKDAIDKPSDAEIIAALRNQRKKDRGRLERLESENEMLREGFNAGCTLQEKTADELDAANRIIFEVRKRAHGRAILAIIERAKK